MLQSAVYIMTVIIQDFAQPHQKLLCKLLLMFMSYAEHCREKAVSTRLSAEPAEARPIYHTKVGITLCSAIVDPGHGTLIM